MAQELTHSIVYKYNMHFNFFNTPVVASGLFLTLDELKQQIQDKSMNEPFELSLTRILRIKDQEHKKIICNAPVKTIKFLVADELLYPKDVRETLMKKYGKIFNLNKMKLDENTPVKRFGVNEKRTFGTRNPTTGAPTPITFHDVYCDQFDKNDICINKELCQLYPCKSGTPDVLTQFLTQNVIIR